MPTIEVVVGPAAERELGKLDQNSLRTVAKAIDRLQKEMRPRGVEKIQGHPGFFRIRAGDFRIIYFPMSDDRLVILVVADRKNAYRSVGDLEKRLQRAS